MNELIYSQIRVLFVFFVTGMSIGVCFDFFRIQRKTFKVRDFVTYIQDIMFWIISGIILIFVIMRFTDGTIRSYMILGGILGIILYFKFISKYIINIIYTILTFLLNILSKLLYPIKKIHKKIKKGWKKENNMV